MIINERLGWSQLDFLTDHLKEDSKQYTGMTGGWGSGKTFIFIKKAILLLKHLKEDGLLAEPNYTMNQRLIIPELIRQLNLYHIPFSYIGGTKNWFKTPYGRIILATQNRRDSLEGHNIGWFGFDEMDLMPHLKAEENWNVITSKLRLGKETYGFFTGTNEGYKFVYNKFYKNSNLDARPTYISNSGMKFDREVHSTDNSRLFMADTFENEDNLPPFYIENLLKDYSKDLAKRYIHGKFINITSGQIYCNFSRENIVDIAFNPIKKTAMSWDVNYSSSPMCTSLIQEFQPSEVFNVIPNHIDPNETLYITTKHFANTNTNTDEQCKEIYEFLQKQNFSGELEIFGDYAGVKREASSSKSHYEIVSNWFAKYGVGTRYEFSIRPTKSIFDRVATLNKMLRNSQGFRQHLISTPNGDKGLSLLIEDYEQVVWTSNNKMDKSIVGRTDPTDADSYFFYYLFDLSRKDPVFY